MDNKEKDITFLESDKDNQLNDYKDLVQKLKTIKDHISLLEKKLFSESDINL